MPTTAAYNYFPAGSKITPILNPEEAMASILPVKLPASTDLAAGTVLGPVTATPGLYKAYNDANADGSQVAAGILQYHCITDAAGNITNMSDLGSTDLAAPMFTQGYFDCSELVGLDAAAVADLQGHLVGSIATGILVF